jgi:hypothetical protein
MSEGREKHPSGAKARFDSSAFCGTAKAVPFQSRSSPTAEIL